MNAVVDRGEVVGLNDNSSDLGKVQSISNVALEEEESVSDLGKGKNLLAGFDIPLSIFHYKSYDSDFFTSWYNVSSEIFKEINGACPEKLVLNLALSVLMLPYIASAALGFVIYSRFRTNSKTQADVGEDKTKKGEISVPKRLAYGVLAAIAIFVNMAVLVALIIPATLALATFYLLNRKLSHSLIAAVKISSGSYQGEHQNIEVSFREINADKSDIRLDMEVKFPPQFKQLLRDLCKDKNDKPFVTRDSENNTILKLSANIYLKNGLVPLRNEIRNVLATSIQGFAKTMEELVKLEKKDITYDKLKELLNGFRLKVVDSIDSKLASYLMQDACQVLFIQTIKFQQGRRGKDFSLEDELKNILVKQELTSQKKELPTEKETIIKDLKRAGAKVPDVLEDRELPVFEAKWKQLIEEGKIAKRTIVDIYKDVYPKETAEALDIAKEKIEELKRIGGERYGKICKELEKVYNNEKNDGLKGNALKRKLEDLFKFEYDDQEVEQRLIKSVIKRAKGELSQSGILDKEKPSLIKQFEDLEKEIKVPLSEKDLKEVSDKVNGLIAKMYLEITKCRMQSLFEGQAKGIKDSCDLLEEDAPSLEERINSHRMEIEKSLKEPEQLKKIIEGSEKYLEGEQNSKGKEHPDIKLIELHLENNKAILKALEQLESEKEALLINEETKNNYKEELTSREKIKFAIIEDELLNILKHETFDEVEVKKLLEKAKLEYYLAEKSIKDPVMKIKDNIRHFCQDLLSPLIDRLANLIINNVPKDNESGFWRIWNSWKVGLGYVKVGWSATKKNESVEGKALNVVHDTYKEVGACLEYFESNYEEVGAFVGDVFSGDGETFKEDVWPQIKDHLYGMWDRFFKDIEFKVESRLDEVSVTERKQDSGLMMSSQSSSGIFTH